MKSMNLLVFFWAGLVWNGAALGEAPKVEEVQGLYEGNWSDASGSAKAEVRVVAMGKGAFKLLARRVLGGKTERADIDGKAGTDTVAFSGSQGGQSWMAAYEDGAIKGTIGEKGVLNAKRVTRRSPTLGKKAPAGAVVLIDGKNFDNMKPGKGDWLAVDEKDGSIQIPKGGMRSVRSVEGSYDLHVEFMCNLKPEGRSQGRGNSGCYLPNGNEIQVLDSFGATTYLGGGCGGLYRFKDPATMEPIPSLEGQNEHLFNLTSLPPLEWQTYDIEYRVRTNDAGKERGFLTVYHNGVKIHDAVELKHKGGTFHFQDHGNPVRYRNIWVVER